MGIFENFLAGPMIDHQESIGAVVQWSQSEMSQCHVHRVVEWDEAIKLLLPVTQSFSTVLFATARGEGSYLFTNAPLDVINLAPILKDFVGEKLVCCCYEEEPPYFHLEAYDNGSFVRKVSCQVYANGAVHFIEGGAPATFEDPHSLEKLRVGDLPGREELIKWCGWAGVPYFSKEVLRAPLDLTVLRLPGDMPSFGGGNAILHIPDRTLLIDSESKQTSEVDDASAKRASLNENLSLFKEEVLKRYPVASDELTFVFAEDAIIHEHSGEVLVILSTERDILEWEQFRRYVFGSDVKRWIENSFNFEVLGFTDAGSVVILVALGKSNAPASWPTSLRKVRLTFI